MEEPFSNLYAKLREEMRVEFKELFARTDVSAVYVTHDLLETLVVSERIIVMNSGKIAQEGSPREVYFNPQDRFVTDFMGAGNIVKGVTGDGPAGRFEVQTSFGLLSVTTAGEISQGGEALVAIRPEGMSLTESNHSGQAHPCEVVTAMFLGNFMEYLVHIGEDSLRVRMPIDTKTFGAEQKLHVSIPESACIAFAAVTPEETA